MHKRETNLPNMYTYYKTNSNSKFKAFFDIICTVEYANGVFDFFKTVSIVLVPYIFIYLFILGVYFIFCNSKNSPCQGGWVGGEQDLRCFSKTKSSSPLIFDKDVNRTAMSLFFY